MYKHHEESINNITNKLKANDGVLAVLIGGSIGHGFASEQSDVDIMIVVSDEEHENRMARSELWFSDVESCNYEGGYIDGKYISPGFLRLVAERGSEPARFAYQGAIIAYSKMDCLQALLDDISTYPVCDKSEKIRHFYAQMDAWRWYCHEALRHGNRYLLNHSVSNVVLFGGRLILALNETLYPYHKWFMRVLESVPDKPDTLMEDITLLLGDPTREVIDHFCSSIIDYTEWECKGMNFPDYFIKNSELNWLNGNTPIADL